MDQPTTRRDHKSMHGRQIQPAFTGAELGHVRGPDLVGTGRVEIPLHQVGGGGLPGPAPAPAPAGMHADQAGLPASAEPPACGRSARPSRASSACTLGAP